MESRRSSSWYCLQSLPSWTAWTVLILGIGSVESVESVESEKYYLTVDTVDLRAQRTLEDVHVVVKDCPAGTVRGLAVESVLHVGLGFLHGLLLVFLVHSGADQLGEG